MIRYNYEGASTTSMCNKLPCPFLPPLVTTDRYYVHGNEVYVMCTTVSASISCYNAVSGYRYANAISLAFVTTRRTGKRLMMTVV